MIKDIEKVLINGNFKFQWKLIKGTENIDIDAKFPRYPILILTCMDPRIDVHRIFQLDPGDVFVLRNSGNIITTDTLRSILIAIHEFNIKYVIILGHIDCGMTKIRLNDLKSKLKADTLEFICRPGHNQIIELRNFFEPFIDIIKNVKNQIKTLRDFRGFPSNIEITGMLYDVDNGWIFEYNLFKDLKFIENFMESYQNLLFEKRLEFTDFLESIEKEIVEIDENVNIANKNGENVDKDNKKEGIQTSNEEKIEEIDLKLQSNKDDYVKNILKGVPKIYIPKIYFPDVKIHIPTIYKKTKKIIRNK